MIRFLKSDVIYIYLMISLFSRNEQMNITIADIYILGMCHQAFTCSTNIGNSAGVSKTKK